MQELLLSNVEVTDGISTKSGSPKPYSIRTCEVLNRAFNSSRGERKTVSVGLKPAELSVADDFFAELLATFQREFDGLPIPYNFETTMDGNGRTILVAFSKVQPSRVTTTIETKPPASSFAPEKLVK